MVVTAARLLYVSYVVGGRVGMSETHCGDLELDPTPPHPYSLLIYTLAPPPQRTKTTRGLTPPPVTYDYAADVLQYAGLGSSPGPPMPLRRHLDAQNDRSGVLLCRWVLEKAAPGPLESHWALEVATRAAPRRCWTLEMTARAVRQSHRALEMTTRVTARRLLAAPRLFIGCYCVAHGLLLAFWGLDLCS